MIVQSFAVRGETAIEQQGACAELISELCRAMQRSKRDFQRGFFFQDEVKEKVTIESMWFLLYPSDRNVYPVPHSWSFLHALVLTGGWSPVSYSEILSYTCQNGYIQKHKWQLIMARMWSKGNTPSLLVRAQICTVTLEINIVISQKIVNRSISWPNYTITRAYTQRTLHHATRTLAQLCL